MRRGRLPELAREALEVRGEVVVVIEGAAEPPVVDLEELARRVQALINEGIPRRDAAARVAAQSGVSKRGLYEASLRRGG